MGLTVIQKGQPAVHVPREVMAEGPEVIEAYVEQARGSGKALKDMNRGELESRAVELEIEDPAQFRNMGELTIAIEKRLEELATAQVEEAEDQEDEEAEQAE